MVYKIQKKFHSKIFEKRYISSTPSFNLQVQTSKWIISQRFNKGKRNSIFTRPNFQDTDDNIYSKEKKKKNNRHSFLTLVYIFEGRKLTTIDPSIVGQYERRRNVQGTENIFVKEDVAATRGRNCASCRLKTARIF